jgi:CRISPR type III-A-associated RAMP protein Csm4
MPAGLLVRLRPSSPWRIGPDSGDRDRVDRILHSDSLFSAVTSAMAMLGSAEEWLDATARSGEPAVRFSSCFPFQGETLFVAPPRNLWPPPPSSKVRWKGARFIPLSVVEALMAGKSVSEERTSRDGGPAGGENTSAPVPPTRSVVRALNEDAWMIDGASECLVPLATPPVPGPFQVSVRSSAAVDRGGVSVEPHSTACLEFTPGAGLWTVAAFANDGARARWTPLLTAAFRLLADSGLGGERSRGFGRAEMPEIVEGELPNLLLVPGDTAAGAYWLLSLFHPASSDQVDWKQGNYSLTTRLGRVESSARWGDPKKPTRMVTEGSVILAAAEPRGAAPDVAPDGFPHPVFRSGFALAIPIPYRPEQAKVAP